MICQDCGKETVKGKFCQFCGAQLQADEVAAAAELNQESIDESSDNAVEQVVANENVNDDFPQSDTEQQVQKPNQFAEQLKEESAKLGDFLLTLIKKPREAKNMTGTYFISGIVTMVILSLLISLNHFISLKSASSSWDSIFGGVGDPTFVDHFLLPFLKYLLMFGLLAVIVFAAAKVVLQELTIKEAFAKYGAYLVPFTLLYLVGFIFTLIKLASLQVIVTSFSLSAIIMLIPIFILTEKEVKGFDLVYTIVAVTLVSFIISGYLSTSTFSSISNILGSL